MDESCLVDVAFAIKRPVSRSTATRLVPFVILSVAAGLRGYDALTDDGIYWPDEVYQSLEPAHAVVFGRGLIPWEYVEGARTWALPGLVAALLWVSKMVGLDRPEQYLAVVELAFVAISLLGLLGCHRLARALGASGEAATAAMALYGLAAPVGYFSHRAMGENLAATLVVWGGICLLLQRPRPWALWLGGSLLGAAVLVRLQSGLFAAGFLALYAARWWRTRRVPAAFAKAAPLHLLAALAVWAMVYGGIDALAWHDAPGARAWGLFHSAVVYVRFNLVEGKSANWGTSPATYYLTYLFRSMPAVAVALALGLVAAGRRALGVLLVALAFLAAHFAIPHKEYRFILPALPLLFAVAAVGLDRLAVRPWVRPLVWSAAAAVAVLSAANRRQLTFGQLGAYLDRPRASAWDDSGPVNRLLLAASKRADLCGLRIDAAHLAWTGGLSYLHRPVPIYPAGTPEQRGTFNYVITTAAGRPSEVAREQGLALVRLARRECAQDPNYSWRLP